MFLEMNRSFLDSKAPRAPKVAQFRAPLYSISFCQCVASITFIVQTSKLII